jgi:peptidyl-prolyl cis-trans isomerase SurA
MSLPAIMEEGDVGGIIEEKDRRNVEWWLIRSWTWSRRVEDHEADYTSDYLKIKDLALRDKQVNVIKSGRENKIKDTILR